MLIDEIVTNIEQRLLQAADEVAHLEHARDVLTDPQSPAPSSNAPASPKTRSATRKRPSTAKRTPEAVPLPKLLALLAESGGLSTRQLAAQSEGSSTQILSLLKDQETAGNVRRSGTRAATRWHLITDEDRIAARAAELTAQSDARSRPASP
jgi:hypothetical protein